MIPYSYYRDVFLGTRIPESEFERVMGEAGALLERCEALWVLEPLQEDAGSLAQCALAEVLYGCQEPQITRKTVGNISLAYAQRQRREGQLLRAISPYFKIYRGLLRGQCR